jgi:hypothetical protein
MRKSLAFLIVAVLGVFAVKAAVSPDRGDAVDSVSYTVSNYGLHVAQPVDMKSFPSDLIPIP